ncbi:hypothetical protein [Leminorella grimontii]|uniref:hypothetical protein n=1 Tax=Leminorella grimontii TaxID=82981 RepID=UPI00321F83DF
MAEKKDALPIGLGYAQAQLAKALMSPLNAEEKTERWEGVLHNILNAQAQYGSRTPFNNVPAWVTPEVVTGGFATGRHMAGGELLEHEVAQLKAYSLKADTGCERLALNGYYLTDAGLDVLCQRLETGAYEISAPEEGALLTVAWLLKNNDVQPARQLIDAISPWFSFLRFYPIPLDAPRSSSEMVRLQELGDSIADLRRIQPNRRLLAQKESVEIWLPFKVNMVHLVQQALDGGEAIDEWKKEAKALLTEYQRLRAVYSLCGKPEKHKGHFSQLRRFIERLSEDSKMSAAPGDIEQIRFILRSHIQKYGEPYSEQSLRVSELRQRAVEAPAHYDVSQALAARLERLPPQGGIDSLDTVSCALSEQEATGVRVPAGTQIPAYIQRKALRSLNTTAEELIAQKLITSSEVLARILPQTTSGIRASCIADEALRELYAAIYRAFRCRRSLLLLDLQHQIQLEELPWIAAIEPYRQKSLSEQELAQKTMREIGFLAVKSFPQAQLPNRLLQELSSLSKPVTPPLFWTDELAADIFMGQFSNKFVHAAISAADAMKNSLYATYFGLDYDQIKKRLAANGNVSKINILERLTGSTHKNVKPEAALLQICEERAGVRYEYYKVAQSGMLIEQQLVLTTHNMNTVFTGLGLERRLTPFLPEMCEFCFRWICRRLQVPFEGYHSALITIKQSAYAWRQLIFYLSFLPPEPRSAFVAWAEAHLQKQRPSFQSLFSPVWRGLIMAAQGRSPQMRPEKEGDPRAFYGWSAQHWMLPLLKELPNGHQ